MWLLAVVVILLLLLALLMKSSESGARSRNIGNAECVDACHDLKDPCAVPFCATMVFPTLCGECELDSVQYCDEAGVRDLLDTCGPDVPGCREACGRLDDLYDQCTHVFCQELGVPDNVCCAVPGVEFCSDASHAVEAINAACVDLTDDCEDACRTLLATHPTEVCAAEVCQGLFAHCGNCSLRNQEQCTTPQLAVLTGKNCRNPISVSPLNFVRSKGNIGAVWQDLTNPPTFLDRSGTSLFVDGIYQGQLSFAATLDGDRIVYALTEPVAGEDGPVTLGVPYRQELQTNIEYTIASSRVIELTNQIEFTVAGKNIPMAAVGFNYNVRYLQDDGYHTTVAQCVSISAELTSMMCTLNLVTPAAQKPIREFVLSGPL